MQFSLAFVGDTYHAVAIIRAAGNYRCNVALNGKNRETCDKFF
jgi:hypothetical protein